MKRFILLILSVVIVFSLSSCGSKKSEAENSTGKAGGAKQEAAMPAEFTKADGKTAAAPKSPETKDKAFVDEGRKIIYTANSVIDVKDLKGAYDSVISKTREIGGYVSNSSIRDTNSQITVRIPAQKLDDFLKYLDTLGGENKETTISTNDVTDQYIDNKSRVKNLKVQEEQLLEIMKKANTVEDTLKIQNELFRIRGEIEAIEGRINMWDKLIEYSTVTIRLNKVQEIGEKEIKVSFISFNETIRGMANGFKMVLNLVVRFITGIFIVIVSLIPIIPFAALAIWLIIRYKKKSKKNINQ